jgi:hypothetical protein
VARDPAPKIRGTNPNSRSHFHANDYSGACYGRSAARICAHEYDSTVAAIGMRRLQMTVFKCHSLPARCRVLWLGDTDAGCGPAAMSVAMGGTSPRGVTIIPGG